MLSHTDVEYQCKCISVIFIATSLNKFSIYLFLKISYQLQVTMNQNIMAYSVGSYDDGLVEQDYGGRYEVDVNDQNKINLFGNAWKSFVLYEPYIVTKNTILSVTLKKLSFLTIFT